MRRGPKPRDRAEERRAAHEHFAEWGPQRAQLFAGGLKDSEREALIALYAHDPAGVDNFLALETG